MQRGSTSTNSKIKEIKKRAFYDQEYFAKKFFPHICEFEFSKLHKDFFKDEVQPDRRGRREVIAAPRGNAKTTFKTTIKTIHAIVFGYEKFILIVGNCGQEADDKVRDILLELEHNERIKKIFGNLAPVRGKPQFGGRWGQSDFVTRNGIRVMAKSKGKQVRGIKHGSVRPTLIICDDLESPDEVNTPEQRLKTENWFFKDLLKSGVLKNQTNIIFIGTVLHPHALLSKLLTYPGWEGRKYRSIISWAENQPLWDTWRDIYCQLDNPTAKQDAFQFYLDNEKEMLKGTEVLWPEGESYYDLMVQLVQDGKAAFYSEKQNEPLDPDTRLFDMSKAKSFEIIYDQHRPIFIKWLDGSNKCIDWKNITQVIAFHDPALGKKPKKQSDPDYAAIVVVAMDVWGYKYVLDAYIEKTNPKKQIEQAYKLRMRWPISKLFLEVNAFQEVLYSDYLEEAEKYPQHPMQIIGVHQYSDKYKRISSLQPEIENGHLLFNKTINPLLIEQLELFPTVHDDGPDALEGAVRQLIIGDSNVVEQLDIGKRR